MTTKNLGLPTDVEGIVAFRKTVVTALEMIDLAIAELQGDSGEVTSVTVDDITDASTTGKAVMKAANAEAARAAIGAGTSDFSGSYADLSGKPTIPTAPQAGTAALLTAGTDTNMRTWSAKMLADEIDRRIAAAATPAG